MDKVKQALIAAGYSNPDRFLRNATVEDLQLARDICVRRIDLLEDREALVFGEATLEIDRAIKEIGR